MLVRDSVWAHYQRAAWYPATISQVTDTGYVVTWRDGDLSDTIKGHEEVRSSRQEPTIRPSPDQRRNARFHTHLLVAMVHSTRGAGGALQVVESCGESRNSQVVESLAPETVVTSAKRPFPGDEVGSTDEEKVECGQEEQSAVAAEEGRNLAQAIRKKRRKKARKERVKIKKTRGGRANLGRLSIDDEHGQNVLGCNIICRSPLSSRQRAHRGDALNGHL
jgi:hypothetical protein